MRRKDREVTDPAKIEDIISRCVCCRIGFNDNGRVYIVPLNFGYEKTGENYTFYFHGAQEGRKIELIRRSPCVGFEMDTHYKLNEGEKACDYSARFQSVIGSGEMRMVTETQEKRHGLDLIMEYTTGKRRWDYPEPMLREVAIFKLSVTELSCKEHL